MQAEKNLHWVHVPEDSFYWNIAYIQTTSFQIKHYGNSWCPVNAQYSCLPSLVRVFTVRLILASKKPCCQRRIWLECTAELSFPMEKCPMVCSNGYEVAEMQIRLLYNHLPMLLIPSVIFRISFKEKGHAWPIRGHFSKVDNVWDCLLALLPIDSVCQKGLPKRKKKIISF